MSEAVFHDGASPAAQAVRVRLGAEELVIERDGVVAACWPLDAVDVVVATAQGLRLGCSSREGRLMVRDPALARDLQAAVRPRRRARAWAKAVRWGAAGLGVVALFAAFLWFAWPRAADAIAGIIPDAWISRLGDSAANGFTSHLRQCTGTEGVAMLGKLLVRLTPDAAEGERPELIVVESAEANAFALPSNRIVFFSALLTDARHPNEVAGVLAHELGHLRLRHPVRHLVRNVGLFLTVELLTGGSGIAGFGATAVALGYSRDFEREADIYARELLAEADIDARPAADFFRRLAAKETSRLDLFSYLSTHPAPAERAEAFAAGRGGGLAMTWTEFARVQSACPLAEREVPRSPRDKQK